jgi:hypothetical protein
MLRSSVYETNYYWPAELIDGPRTRFYGDRRSDSDGDVTVIRIREQKWILFERKCDQFL